jgi:phospholipid/cholesterol/gamma-HCH transport system substrate-binding protein
MSKVSNKRAVIVGIFVALGLVILIVAVFTLGGQQKTFSRHIKVTAIFNDVSGLQQGNNVWFSGVKIGTVKTISIYGNSQVKVLLFIDKKAQEFIRKDAKAKIGTDGLIGNKIISVYGGSPQAGEIENEDSLEVEDQLSTEDIMNTLQKNNKNLIDITADFKVVSKRLAEGQGTVGALLTDETLYKNLQSTVSNLQVAARNSEQLTKGISEYTAKLQSPGSLAGGLVNDTVIMQNLQLAIQQLKQAATTTNAFTDQLQTAGSRLNDKDNALGVLLNDTGTAVTLRNTLDNLNSSSQKLDEDLEALQHNFLFRPYFRKKAKREAKEKEKASAQVPVQ